MMHLLHVVGGVSTSEDKMQVVFEELQDLRGVWSELSRIWAQIDEIREKPWLSVQPRKLRQHLDTLMAQLKELPARLRQYSSYEYVKKLLQGYTKVRLAKRVILELPLVAVTNLKFAPYLSNTPTDVHI
jgi:dynein heavy chain 1